MNLNYKNWPYRWFGYWIETSPNRTILPSIKAFQSEKINQGYDHGNLVNYLTQAHVLSVTSALSRVLPISGERINGQITLATRTDGHFIWVDDIANYIAEDHLVLPDGWYDRIFRNNFAIPKVTKKELASLELPPWMIR